MFSGQKSGSLRRAWESRRPAGRDEIRRRDAGAPRLGAANWIFVQETFNRLARFRIARTAVIRLELEAVENGRVVAGGNHHAADGAQVFHGE